MIIYYNINVNKKIPMGGIELLTKEQVLNALRKVYDPEIGRSIVDLDMVRNIQIEGDKVTIDINLTVKGCPLQDTIKKDAIEEVSKLEGVSEVIVNLGSMTEEERQNLARKLSGGRKPIFENTRVIVVGSGKGGVGKSTVAANLAVALARLGFKVGLLDADVLGFSVPRLLGIVDERPYALDEHTILPLERFGIKVISMGNFTDEDTPLIWRGPLLSGVLDQFFNDVYWGELDYLVLDLPPGTGDIPLTVMQKLPESKFVLVTTPQASASHVAGRIGYMAKKVNLEVIGIVENMSYFECPNCHQRYNIFGEGETEKLAQDLGTEILVKIPITVKVRELSDVGIPPALDDGPEGLPYIELAEKVVEKVRPIK
ncbi:ATPase-like, ParA/MinD [Thermoanaerobacter ethanolicus JW 200]|uniref:Mrp/NBP35 family ATP-binding protein n=1 Tax=Thermoanaerobacter ethanolicus TaxID=1757 RepID=UPI000202B49F|nr:ATPase-like, ParA/MinD [Thermoanaerobacter ethanolicus JW 200]